ncbi:hypothetical protein QJQ45_001998 [Haematococcus lacustris]|nr:hypothetical protein QJQ45_001998 [Haematococcus lacustris]
MLLPGVSCWLVAAGGCVGSLKKSVGGRVCSVLGTLEPLVSVMECGLEGPDAAGASERASACERSSVTKALMQGLAGKLGLSPTSPAAAEAVGSHGAPEGLSGLGSMKGHAFQPLARMPSPIAVFCMLALFRTLTAHAHQATALDCDKAITSELVDGSSDGSSHSSFNGMLRSFTRRLTQVTTSTAVAVAQAASAGNGEAIAMLSRLFKARTPNGWLLGGFQTGALAVQNPASTSRALAFAFGQNGITVPTSALTAATASAQRRGGPANEAFASALAQASSQNPALRQSLFPALPTGFLTQPEIARRFPDLRMGGENSRPATFMHARQHLQLARQHDNSLGLNACVLQRPPAPLACLRLSAGRRSMLQAVAVAAANANANGAVASAVAVAATNGNGLAIAIAISVSSNCAGWNTAVTSGLAQAFSTNPATTERSLAQAVAQAQALGAASAVAATAALAASGGAAQQTLWTNALAQAGAQNPNAIVQLLPQLPPSLQQAPQLRSFTAGGAGGQGNRVGPPGL